MHSLRFPLLWGLSIASFCSSKGSAVEYSGVAGSGKVELVRAELSDGRMGGGERRESSRESVGRRRTGDGGGGSTRRKPATATAGRSESQTTFSPALLKKNVEQWLSQVEKMGSAGIYEEYTGVRAAEFPELTHKSFDAAPNERKRYCNIKCWDQSRVVLPDGGFVHANYVNGPGRERKWILCQGPLSTTVGHFWEMVWQEQVGVVVMLCLVKERDPDGAERDKCFQYWPAEEGARIKAAGLEVTTEKSWMDEPQMEGQRIKVSVLWLKKGINRRKLFRRKS